MGAAALVPSAENVAAADLFHGLPARYDLLAEVLSLGQNHRWRHELVGQVAGAHPRRILDVATGTAGVAIALARLTDAEVVGVDISEPMLRRGRQMVRDRGLEGRIRLEVGRAEDLPFPDGSFDAVAFTYLLRYVADPGSVIGELARVLRPGGMLASLDFYVPPAVGWRLGWRLYTRCILPPAGLLLGGRPWWCAGRFLGPNIEAHYSLWPLQRIAEAWRAAGLTSVQSRSMSLGGGLVMWGVKGAS